MDSDKPKNKTTKKEKPHKTKSSGIWKWPLLVLVMSLTFCFTFAVASEYALSGAGIAVAVVVIVVFIIIAIIADMVGVAVAAAKMGPFRSMASKKVRGAKEAIKLIQNAEKVASVTADVLGDICSILSGSAGAAITAVLIMNAESQFVAVLIASAVSAVIAGLTIFGKALWKKYAMRNAEKIILIAGKIVSLFHRQSPSRKKDKDHNCAEKGVEKQESEDEEKSSKE